MKLKEHIKRQLILFVIVLIAMTVICMMTVIALDKNYYKDKFPVGIWINDIYCTGLTVEEVATQLENKYDYGTISVITIDNTKYVLEPDDYGLKVDYKSVVDKLFIENNGLGWIDNVINPRRYNVNPDLVYKKSFAISKLSDLEFLNKNLYDENNTIAIVKSAKGGYFLLDETKNLLLREKTIDIISEGIVNQLTEIDLNDYKNECYKTVPYTDEMNETIKKWNGIKEFQSFNLVYTFGDVDEVVDENVVVDWIMLDEYGNIVYDENYVPVLDKALVKEYISYLADKYDTVGIEREFKTTQGDVVKVPGGEYGNQLDQEAEYKFLLEAFESKKNGRHTPIYKTEAKEKGTDDIGDTYIEIDIKNQHLYYYEDAELKLDTPVVTGNASRKWDTPRKVCDVYFKQKNRVLRGANYATPVKYWMAVNGHIGIHDATWRDEFGGNIYETDGSHGCINTPLEAMAELYEMVDEGTPVIIY